LLAGNSTEFLKAQKESTNGAENLDAGFLTLSSRGQTGLRGAPGVPPGAERQGRSLGEEPPPHHRPCLQRWSDLAEVTTPRVACDLVFRLDIVEVFYKKINVWENPLIWQARIARILSLIIGIESGNLFRR